MDTKIEAFGLYGTESIPQSSPDSEKVADKRAGTMRGGPPESDLGLSGDGDDLRKRIKTDYVIVKETDSLFKVIEKLHADNKALLALVVSDEKKVVGVITRDLITKALADYDELFYG
jgi:hypothetical protein